MARGRTVTLAEAKALAGASQPFGDLPVVVDARVVEQLNQLIRKVHVRRGLAGAPPPSVARLAGE
jgi:hypothetical protein